MATDPDQPSGEEQALAAARDIVSGRAPWKSGVSWQVILGEGIVLAVVGAVIWLPPGFGATSILQLLGIMLLLTAGLSAWRVIREQVAPASVGPVSFRAGVGMAVGLVVVVGSLIADSVDVVTVALAVVLGVGFVLYGLSVIVAALSRREPGAPYPVAALVLAGGAIVVGALMMLRAQEGIDALVSTFAWLGVVLLVIGLVLIGWAALMRSRDQHEPTD